jgi:5-methyltetrahydrofolate--homocysteine methyltransferase
VSFGLPARSAITAAFIAMAMTAGLTAAIMNPLSADVTNAARAADLLLGNDEYGSAWISAFRSGEALVGGP